MTADLFLFMGQSNMAGRGIWNDKWPEKAPALIEGAGYEYRAVTAPDRLFPISEPFGVGENRKGGIDDGTMKTGSLVTAFANAYYKGTGIPIVGISASKGGSSILQWQPGGAFMEDTKERLTACRELLEKQDVLVRHTYMLWCQGETDGDHGMGEDDYKKYFRKMLEEMKAAGVETVFLIRIGQYNGTAAISYEGIRSAQEKLAEEYDDVVAVSEEFAFMKERGLMKDDFHYYQAAYNEVGELAGMRTAEYVNRLS